MGLAFPACSPPFSNHFSCSYSAVFTFASMDPAYFVKISFLLAFSCST